MTVRVLKTLFAVCLASGVVAADATAAIGDLFQKPGAAGCLSAVGLCSPGTALNGAAWVTTSPDGKSAYVASQDADAVSVFDRAPDGTLTQKPGTAGCISETGSGGVCVNGRGLNGARSVTVSLDGQNVYVASEDGDAVAEFDRAANGTLTQQPGLAGCVSETGDAGACLDVKALDRAAAVTVSPDGLSAYVASYNDNAVAVFNRASDGTLTPKAGTAGCTSEDGSAGGAAGACVDGRALFGAFSVTASPDDQSVYVTSSGSDAVVVFDRSANGTLTQKPGQAGCISDDGSAGLCFDGTAINQAVGVTVSADGQSTYVVSNQSDAVAVFDRAPNGMLTQKPGVAGCISDDGSAGACVDGTAISGAFSVTVSPDGKSTYVASPGGSDAVAVFDRSANGSLTQKPGTAGCISDDGTAGACVDGTALAQAYSVTVSPDGRSAYVASRVSNAVAVFDRSLTADNTGTPPPPPPSLAPDTTRPLLSALSLSPTRFRAASRGASIAARVGSRVSYRLSEPAAVRFTIERARPGRRARGRCAKPGRSNRRGRRCTRYVTQRGGFTHQGKAGQNRFTFRGRLRARKLAPGRYRLRAVATDPAGNKSVVRRSRFRIVRR